MQINESRIERRNLDISTKLNNIKKVVKPIKNEKGGAKHRLYK